MDGGSPIKAGVIGELRRIIRDLESGIAFRLPSADQKRRNGLREILGIIADKLSRAGWSWAVSQPWIIAGRTIFVADA
jgi:hypothetical protein